MTNILTLFIALILFGCGGDNDAESNEQRDTAGALTASVDQTTFPTQVDRVELSKVDASSAIGEDAMFWEIVAWQRSGANRNAEARARLFLKRHPTSRRADEIRVILGSAIGERLPAEAERLLLRAKQSPNGRIRRKAEAALQRLR